MIMNKIYTREYSPSAYLRDTFLSNLEDIQYSADIYGQIFC